MKPEKNLFFASLRLCVMLLFCFSCAATPTAHPVCRHKAVHCALVWHDIHHEPVGIIRGFIKDKHGNIVTRGHYVLFHHQAFCIHEGRRCYLVLRGGDVEIGERDPRIEVTEELTLEQAIKRLSHAKPQSR